MLIGVLHRNQVNHGDEMQLTASELIKWTRDHLVVERPDLFAQGNSV